MSGFHLTEIFGCQNVGEAARVMVSLGKAKV